MLFGVIGTKLISSEGSPLCPANNAKEKEEDEGGHEGEQVKKKISPVIR